MADSKRIKRRPAAVIKRGTFKKHRGIYRASAAAEARFVGGLSGQTRTTSRDA